MAKTIKQGIQDTRSGKAIEYGIRGKSKKAIEYGIRGKKSKSIEYGIQGTAKKAISYGLQTPKSEFEMPFIGRQEPDGE